MKFPVCPNCQGEWQDCQWCYECDLVHHYPDLTGECVCRSIGGTKYGIYWSYLDGRRRCVVMQNWIDGNNGYEKCVSKNVVFPFDITEEQLENMLVLL